MQSVMGSRRPNCIIVDEIDGTAGAPGLLPIRLLRKPQSHEFGYLLNLPRCDLSAMRLVVTSSKTTVQCSRCDRTSTPATGGNDSKSAVQALLKLVYGGAGGLPREPVICRQLLRGIVTPHGH